MKNRRTQGFTLIELLIVIAIIGILAAVLIPNLLGARVSAQKTAGQAYGRQVLTSAQALLADGKALTITGTALSDTCAVAIGATVPTKINSPVIDPAVGTQCRANKDGQVIVGFVIGASTYAWNSITNTLLLSTDTGYVAPGAGIDVNGDTVNDF